MGIQINGNTDTISAVDGGLTVSGADFTGVSAGTTAAPSISPTGDSNTGIFFPSADTIAFGEGGVEVARINSSGNVGIGTDNPTVFGTAYRTLQLNPAAGTGDGSAIRFMYDGGTANTNDLVIYTNTSQSYIRANGARNLDIMRNGSTVATFNANGIALPSGLGIDFSATSDGSGTTTSELLDDYEEGTFTPSFTGGTSGSGYTRQVGEYTKVGRLVTFILTIDGDGLTGTATAIEIGGLPFTSRNVAELGGAQYTYPGNFDTTNDRRFWLVAQNNTTLSYRSATSANINGNLVNNVNSQFVLYGHYFTDS